MLWLVIYPNSYLIFHSKVTRARFVISENSSPPETLLPLWEKRKYLDRGRPTWPSSTGSGTNWYENRFQNPPTPTVTEILSLDISCWKMTATEAMISLLERTSVRRTPTISTINKIFGRLERSPRISNIREGIPQKIQKSRFLTRWWGNFF